MCSETVGQAPERHGKEEHINKTREIILMNQSTGGMLIDWLKIGRVQTFSNHALRSWFLHPDWTNKCHTIC